MYFKSLGPFPLAHSSFSAEPSPVRPGLSGFDADFAAFVALLDFLGFWVSRAELLLIIPSDGEADVKLFDTDDVTLNWSMRL